MHSTMSEITGISPQKHDKLRCNIEVDGVFFCGMTLETVMKNRLKTGSAVTAEELSRMQLESEKATAFDKALSHISVTMKTEYEIRAFLKRKGYLQDVSDYVVEKMKSYGFIDDSLYAQRYCESVSKKKGGRLIALELKRKGIGEEAVQNAVSGISDETESAKRILEKYLRGKELDRAVLQKAYRYLLSKGYEYDTARAALESLKDDED